MTGYDIYKKSAIRLGYMNTSNNTTLKSHLEGRALELINQILSDLRLENMTRLSDELSLDKMQTEALTNGLSMLLSLSEADDEKSKIYTDIYNAKRSGVLSKNELRTDCLPSIQTGV